jgi:GNAT superfamily N-acetyltransferase
MSGVRISSDQALMQIDVIHGYLVQSYWSAGIPLATVERAIANSICVGAFADDGGQIGFARVITDRATFAYLADVFVLEAARGQGVAAAMLRHLEGLPELHGLRRWLLATRDAHGLYESLGWQRADGSPLLMQRIDPDVYQRATA